ncbi:MAG: DUF4364 family protein [Clostridia bacterium]|nr:DUF4364 family protein [Clostridia bacterium]
MLPLPHAMMDEQDRKLYTLLALQELGSCTHMQLLYFMFENDIMTFFDLSLALGELVDDGQAAKMAHPADSLYTITEAGKELLSFFANRMPHSKVKLITEQAPAWRERFTREKQFVSKVTQNASGEYILHLNLMDGFTSMLSIDAPIPDRSLAEKMASRWEKNAGDIYMYLMNKLGEDQ